MGGMPKWGAVNLVNAVQGTNSHSVNNLNVRWNNIVYVTYSCTLKSNAVERAGWMKVAMLTKFSGS